MAQSIKLNNDTYWDAESMIARSISPNDFLTLNSGFQLINCNLVKIGTILSGQIIIKTNTNYGVGTNVFSIKQPYRPKNYFYKTCGLSNAEWGINNVGYVYMGGADCVIADQNGTGYQYAAFDFTYEI